MIPNRLKPAITWRRAGIWVLLSLAAAGAGPFGTFNEVDILRRLAYWGVVIGAAMALHGFVFRMVEARMAQRPRPLRCGVKALVLTALFTPPLSLYTAWMWGDVARTEIVPTMLDLVLVVLPGAVCILALQNLVQGEPEAPPQRRPRILDRLPEEAPGRVQRLSVRDHYVDVFTETGCYPLLMRFSDAMSELDGVDGLRVHRSHWVAAEAIESARRDRDRIILHLRGGDTVPVSRTYRPALAERGLLPAERA